MANITIHDHFCLDFDPCRRSLGKQTPESDALIAAMASAHGALLDTRNPPILSAAVCILRIPGQHKTAD
jgi:predicted nucleic acid-binding protein